ncbi:putative ABC transport system ATP-binding protein [Knoellia remsis]|uniref:Putative ABC transport system ATP-binding protein n=2 Tax=Knoellia remsis TaxID=407159 RepID=A0A2T0UTM9_9MICO|nr:putative ABC transport system ATP-binding protein [Knoellia remsis]
MPPPGTAPPPTQPYAAASPTAQPSPNTVADFLAAFGGDVEAAVAALRAHHPTTGAGISPIPSRPRRQRSGDHIITVTDLQKTYRMARQRVAALGGVSLEIDRGEFVALTGASGSGKSTLLQLIGGLDKPSGGSVVVDGVNIGKLSDAKLSRFRNQTIGFVFQFFYLQPFLRLTTNTEVPGMFARAPRKQRRAHAQALIDEVGLGDRSRHLPREMSGGQMQRAAIARALLNRPPILLADEPTGNLDSATGASIIELFERIRDEFGTTVVIVTHDDDLARRADRTIRLSDGRIVPQGVVA